MRTRCPTARLAAAWGLAALLGGAALPAAAVASPDAVLVLYSNSRLLPANVEIDRALRDTIETTPARPVAIYDEFLDVPLGQTYVETFSAYLSEKYASQAPAVILAVSEEALRFLVLHRDHLFPGVPVVHMMVSQEMLRTLPPLPKDVVGVPVQVDVKMTVEQALGWHPRARNLVFVTGASPWDREWEARLRLESAPFQARVAIEYLAGLPTKAVRDRLANLPRGAVVYTPGYFQDGAGQTFTPRQAIVAMSEVSSAPLYSAYTTFVGHGIVGGYMWTFDSVARQAGRIVNEVLAGMPPGDILVPATLSPRLNVDWRQMERWGIDGASIPAGAIIHFRSPSFLEEHRVGVAVAGAVMLLQAALIAGLLVERRRRKEAERAVHRRTTELAHATRVAIAGELTGAIAHQINQPLGAILSNAEAAEIILGAGGDRREEIRAILADIRRDDLRASEVIRNLRTMLARHEVERRPIDLNGTVAEVESILGSESRRRRVRLVVRSSPSPVTVVGDPIQVQQVIINLVMNAMDAMNGLPEDERTVDVTVHQACAVARIEVRDRGIGLDPDTAPRLFESFFSTKPGGMGLGLSIARTLLAEHGGRIRAENGPTRGAVFIVELPATSGATAGGADTQ